MKQTIILLALLLTSSIAGYGQITSGTITYDEVYRMKIELPAEASQFKDMFPRENHVARTLTFSPDAAIFQAAKGADTATKKTATSDDGEMRMVIKMDVPQDIVYTDLKAAKTIAQKDLFSRKFLVTSDLPKRAWKPTGQQKTIIGYPCQEATSITDKDTVSAWFTTAIPVPTGPQELGGLPGMILEASQTSAGGQLTITAVKVQEGLGSAGIPGPPTKGKKVTREEFKAIADAKRKEMQQEFGGSGNVIIRIKDN